MNNKDGKRVVDIIRADESFGAENWIGLAIGVIVISLILFGIFAEAQEPAVLAAPVPESRPISDNTALKLENLQLRFQLAVQQQQTANQAVVEGRAAIQTAVEALWTELKIEVKDRGNWNVDLNGRKATKKVVAKE